MVSARNSFDSAKSSCDSAVSALAICRAYHKCVRKCKARVITLQTTRCKRCSCMIYIHVYGEKHQSVWACNQYVNTKIAIPDVTGCVDSRCTFILYIPTSSQAQCSTTNLLFWKHCLEHAYLLLFAWPRACGRGTTTEAACSGVTSGCLWRHCGSMLQPECLGWHFSHLCWECSTRETLGWVLSGLGSFGVPALSHAQTISLISWNPTLPTAMIGRVSLQSLVSCTHLMLGTRNYLPVNFAWRLWNWHSTCH